MTAVSESTLTAAETRRADQIVAHKVLGELLTVLPSDVEFGQWAIRDGGVDALVTRSTPPTPVHDWDGYYRQTLRSLATLIGLVYEEEPHGQGQKKLRAVGEIDGIKVELWQLTMPCPCGCHRKGSAS